jgi:hypothetical protein
VLAFPSAFQHAGQALTFGILAAACFAQAIFTYFFVQETSGRSLEEIAQMGSGRHREDRI